MINDPATNEPQKINLQAAINLYHAKELPGLFKWIQDGKVVRHKDIDFRRSYWVEVFPFAPYDLSTHCAYPHFNLGLWPATILTGYGSSSKSLLRYSCWIRKAMLCLTRFWRRALSHQQSLMSVDSQVMASDSLCLYFATAPGNQHLYVAKKKNGIIEQLPVV
jgi:hypothetical protein